MDALVMCGGRGTRLDASGEKPLYEVAGRPMVARVLDALTDAAVETIHAAITPQTPETQAFLDGRVSLIETPGEGYVTDLMAALEQVGRPVITVAADVPLLAASHVNGLCDATTSVSVCVPTRLKRALGVATDESDGEYAPTGLNVVAAGEERREIRWDARLAVNVNYASDATVAETLI